MAKARSCAPLGMLDAHTASARCDGCGEGHRAGKGGQAGHPCNVNAATNASPTLRADNPPTIDASHTTSRSSRRAACQKLTTTSLGLNACCCNNNN